MIGTSVSALFLLAISIANIVILISVCRVFAAVRRGDRLIEDDLHDVLAQRGLLARMLRSVFGIIAKSWHMYPLGLLFGLGFDTASEIGLLGISAAQGSAGMPVWSILVFPALFTAGMSLVDTTDSVLMVNAYGWAFIKPIRKLYYNLTITLVSIVVAMLIGSVEALGLLGEKLGLAGAVLGFHRRAERQFRRAGLPDHRHIRRELAGLDRRVSLERIRRDRPSDRDLSVCALPTYSSVAYSID